MTTRPSAGEFPRGATVIASLTNGSPWTRPLTDKVPEVSATFWLLTILATTLGATVADFLSTNLGRGLGLGMSATTANVSLVVAGTLILQLSTGRCVPGLYWLAAVPVSALGTLLSDDLVDGAGVSLWVVSAVFGALLAVVFAGWHHSEHTLSVHAVRTRRGEAWYWCAVLCAFSLGTAISDLVSANLVHGYATAVLGAALGVITLAHHRLRLTAVAAFWAAYVVARACADSVGDLLSATPRDGGLGLGTNATSVTVLGILIVFGLGTVGAHRIARVHRDAAA